MPALPPSCLLHENLWKPGKERLNEEWIDLKTEIRLMETNVELKISMVGRREKNFLLIILKNSTIT